MGQSGIGDLRTWAARRCGTGVSRLAIVVIAATVLVAVPIARGTTEVAAASAVGTPDGGGGEPISACGGAGQRACCVTERIPSCNTGLTEVIGCSGDCVCGGFNPGGFLVSAGTCFQLDSDGFPPSCGGLNENACTVTLQLQFGITSCKSGLTEVPFPGGKCIQLDSDGFPAFCGGEGERGCTTIPLEHVPSCKSGLTEVPFTGGTCIKLDSDGFPEFCGGLGERGCTAIPLEHIPSCKPGLGEVIGGLPPTSTCIEVDADGFPPFCGGDYERPCTLVPFEHVPSCKADLIEVGTDDGRGLVECRAACGRNGQRACSVLGLAPWCAEGLSVLHDDFNVCGQAPVDWGESNANEAPRGAARTVFFFHGRSGDFNPPDDPPADDLLRGLHDKAKNVKQIYGVDWNNKGNPSRKLTTVRFFDPECRKPGASCRRTWGTDEFEWRNFEITEVARATADAIKHLPTEGDITIIGGSFGAIMARQLVYRHYDELRAAGKRIAEVITIAGPNRGGQAGALEIGGTGLLENVPGTSAALQTAFSCLPNPLGATLAEFIPQAARDGCQLGTWIDWMRQKEEDTVGAPWFIDNRSYPQIRWIAMAGNGKRLFVDGLLASAQTLGMIGTPYTDILERLKDTAVVPFHDSDETITVRSALGLDVDECYPFQRERSASGGSGPDIVPTSRFYEWAWQRRVVPEVQEALSAVCYHEGARHDPRVVEDAGPPIRSTVTDEIPGQDDGLPQELTRVSHVNLFSNETVTNFVVAALNLFGDTNGDGVVNDADLKADAGADRSVECAGALTPVNLVASASGVPAGATLTYTWAGLFGTATGKTALVDLPLGTHTITLTVGSQTGVSVTDQFVVTIGDTTAPVPDDAIGHTIEATAAAGTPFALVTGGSDLCGPVTAQLSPALTAYPLGATIVTVTTSDASGNSANGTVTVTVVDTTPPSIAAPATVRAEANAVLSSVSIGSATATDVFPVTLVSNAPDRFPLGDTLVTWTATDANGNAATATHTVTVVDRTAPVLSLPPNVVVTATGALTQVAIGLATATDIFGAAVSHNAPASFPIGTSLVTWTAVDPNGNRASATQKVEVLYAFGGFSGPIEPGGTYKANRTLPLMFTLSFADGTLAPAATATLSVARVGPDNALGDPLDIDLAGAADEGNVFRFNGNHYQFNLRTNGWSAGRYRFTVTLNDGRNYWMDVVLR